MNFWLSLRGDAVAHIHNIEEKYLYLDKAQVDVAELLAISFGVRERKLPREEKAE